MSGNIEEEEEDNNFKVRGARLLDSVLETQKAIERHSRRVIHAAATGAPLATMPPEDQAAILQVERQMRDSRENLSDVLLEKKKENKTEEESAAPPPPQTNKDQSDNNENNSNQQQQRPAPHIINVDITETMKALGDIRNVSINAKHNFFSMLPRQKDKITERYVFVPLTGNNAKEDEARIIAKGIEKGYDPNLMKAIAAIAHDKHLFRRESFGSYV